MKRPVVVWIVAPVLLVVGLVGVFAAGAALPGAAEDSEVLVFGLATLLSAAQAASGVALFAGARWGRTGTALLCTLTIVLTWLAALGERIGPLPVVLSMAVNVTLIFAVLGQQVYDWTGGDRPRPVYGHSSRLDGDDTPDEGATDEA